MNFLRLPGALVRGHGNRSRSGRSPWWLLARVVLGIAALVGGVLATAILSAPGVEDAGQRVVAIDLTHNSQPVYVGPSERIAVALIAVEDQRFYTHHGIDLIGVSRGLWGVVRGVDSGGSTLDQQLAHVLYGADYYGPWADLQRTALALKIEGHYTKSAILNLYLNGVYFGHGYYGIGAASKGYFGLAPQQLSWAQAALIAGLPEAPSDLDPYLDRTLAVARQHHVLDRLVATGALTSQQEIAIEADPLLLGGI